MKKLLKSFIINIVTLFVLYIILFHVLLVRLYFIETSFCNCGMLHSPTSVDIVMLSSTNSFFKDKEIEFVYNGAKYEYSYKRLGIKPKFNEETIEKVKTSIVLYSSSFKPKFEYDISKLESKLDDLKLLDGIDVSIIALEIQSQLNENKASDISIDLNYYK